MNSNDTNSNRIEEKLWKFERENIKETLDVEGELRAGKSVLLMPEGYSMLPFLYPGKHAVRIAPLMDRLVLKGDIVLYRRPTGKLILHRVHHLEGDMVWTVGDNQTILEGPIPKSILLGKVMDILVSGDGCSAKPIGNMKHTIYKVCSKVWLFLFPIRPVLFLMKKPLKIMRRK